MSKTTAQKLILPINKARLTASMKTQAYLKKFGFVHYGVDIISTDGKRSLYASGNGVVVGAGVDSVVGNVVAVRYDDAVNRRTGKTGSVVLRYFHLASISVRPGVVVTKDTVLGVYGNTGSLSMAPHLHLEADTDAEHPLYSPTVGNSSFLRGRAKGATDATMTNPLDWLYCKTGAPDSQTWTTANDEYILPADKTMENMS